MTVLDIETPRAFAPFLKPSRYKGAFGGRGCMHGDTLIDTPTGKVRMRDWKGGAIMAFDGVNVIEAYAYPSARYKPSMLFTVITSDGEFTCTAKHRVFTRSGWMMVGDLLDTACHQIATFPTELSPTRKSDVCHLPTSQDTCQPGSLEDAQRCWKTILNYLVSCSAGHRQYGEQPLEDEDTYLSSLRRLAGAQRHTSHALTHKGGRAFENTDSPLPSSRRLSILDAVPAAAGRSCEGSGSCSDEMFFEQLSGLCRDVLQSRENSNPLEQAPSFALRALDAYSLAGQAESLQIICDIADVYLRDDPCAHLNDCNGNLHYTDVIEIREFGESEYFDIFVPMYGNYFANGALHHNSGKSHFFAEMLVEAHVMDPNRKTVGVREIQKSIKMSVKQLIEDKIKALGVGSYFDVQDVAIKSLRGDGIIIFQGMQNHTADSIKSLEGFDCAWIEEAQSISQRSLDLLRPTIRKPGSEIWATWNPYMPTDPIDVLLRSDTPPNGSIVKSINFSDNPWFPDVLREEMEYDRDRDPDKYAHVWLGEYVRNTAARVFRNWRVEEFEAPEDATFRLGADWGFSVDPTVLVRCYIVGRTLYVDYEAYRVGCEILDTPDLFMQVPDAESWPVIADSARPETISHMQKHGFPKMMAATKGPNSLHEGVEWLKSYDIVVHPRCTHTIDELALYSYKVDALTGLVLPVLEDKKNHVIDALRYACEGVRRAQKAQKPRNATPMPSANRW